MDVGGGDAGELVREFLRKHGLREAELALEEDIKEREAAAADGGGELGSYFDFEKFLFVLPPVRIPTAGGGSRLVGPGSCSGSLSEDEFVSLKSATSGHCSSEFVNPYGLRSSSQANSETSSDRLSQFGTARDYPEFDMQNDIHWYDDRDDGQFMTPCFSGQDYFGCQSEDKFIMNSKSGNGSENAFGLYDKSDGLETDSNADYLDKPCLFDTGSTRSKIRAETLDCDLFEKGDHLKLGFVPTDQDMAANYSPKDLSGNCFLEELKPVMVSVNEDRNIDKSQEDEDVGEVNSGTEHNGIDEDELPIDDFQDEGFEVFNLRIIHRKNRTGFEESKELPVVLNSVIAGRYYVTEYLGSAAFSKVIQAHDLHTGMDVCLKIIKNDKDFFDQSLDEIKLLKLVNMHDPADERHVLRLYDYFYHQEHLFIVCELLKANLYEFQKFNQESDGEAYFTPSRLQVITRQCLEALEYLHHLGIMHCDLKPENILIKSYRRCEIKVIDLGSSCFHSDNLCLYVQSRSYRAPEVILGLPYDEKIDVWSLGCILAELCSGEVLFPNNAVVMILARIIGMFGPIDFDMLVGGQETSKYFSEDYDLYHINEETDQLEYIIPEESTLEDHLQTSDVGFIEFVRYLLEVNPLRRPTAQEALEHPWLSHTHASQ